MTPRAAAKRVRALPPEDVTVALWLASWREFFPGDRKQETAVHDAYMLAPFLERHGRKLLSAVTPLMAQQWALRHPSQLRYLRLAWDKAVLMQIVPYNVWKCVELPRRTKPTRGVPTLEQLDAALGRARARGGWWEQFADLAEATAFSGARQGGMKILRREDVDLEGRRMVVTEKGGKTRALVLTGRALDAMTSAMARAEERIFTELVFVNNVHRPLKREAISRAWKEVRGDFDGPFHTLKHFAGTWLAAQGVDERDIAIQLGHTDSQGRPYVHLVRRVYVHPDHAEALDRIERTIERKVA